jgi:hypothetical protein
MAATNKCLTQSNKSRTGGKATKIRQPGLIRWAQPSIRPDPRDRLCKRRQRSIQRLTSIPLHNHRLARPIIPHRQFPAFIGLPASPSALSKK